MPTATYIALANITIGSSAPTEITFSSIPNTYRDLVLVWSGVSTAQGGMRMRFNNNSESVYNVVAMQGNGSTFSSNAETYDAAQPNYYLALRSTSVQNGMIQIMDYSATDKHKTYLARCGGTSGEVVAVAERWGKTDAITSVKLYTYQGGVAFGNGFTACLYGIVS